MYLNLISHGASTQNHRLLSNGACHLEMIELGYRLLKFKDNQTIV